jgi:excisionase family DNA binding protein
MGIFNNFVTLKEAASISGYHPDYIGALVRSNKVKGKKVGKNWYVSRKEVQDYLTTKH